jgi:hypothetical protein
MDFNRLLIGIQAGGRLSKNYLSAPTQAPTRYAEVGNRVEVGNGKEAETKRRRGFEYIIRHPDVLSGCTNTPNPNPNPDPNPNPNPNPNPK